jgi:hypothetical protein
MPTAHEPGSNEPHIPDDAELEAFDADGDGHIGVIDSERARLGIVDAELEQAAQEGGVKGKLADIAHKVVDKLDND